MPKVSEFTALTRLGTGAQLTAVGEKLIAPYLLWDGVRVKETNFTSGPHHGGTAASDTWNQRSLNGAANLMVGVPAGLPSWFTFSAPTFSLTAGWYIMEGHSIAYGVNANIVALRIPALGDFPLAIGTPENSPAGTPINTKSTFYFAGYIDAVTLSLDHHTESALAFDGLGYFPDSAGISFIDFAEVRIWRLS